MRRIDSRPLLSVLAGLALAAPALAQVEDTTVPENLLSMLGDWRLEQEDPAQPACALDFTDTQTSGGWAVHVPEPCPAPYPPAGAMVSWTVGEDGSVHILDAGDNVLMRFLEGEDGVLMTGPGVVPAFYLMIPWDADGTGGEVGDVF